MGDNFPLPSARCVFVLAPHPDDETLGCGGTIALYALKGVDVHVAIISDGAKIGPEISNSAVNVVEARKQEALNAAAILGVKHTYFFDFPDGDLRSCKHEIKEKILNVMRICNPDIVFAPSLVDYHDDHIVVSEIAFMLLNTIPGLKVAFYGVYGTIRFNTLVNISDVMRIKEQAVRVYYHSLFQLPDLFAEAIKGLNTFMSMYNRQRGYYEAFWLVTNPINAAHAIEWITYGRGKEDPASVFLSKIQVVDELLHELKKSHGIIATRETEIQQLKRSAEDREETIHELKARLDRMTKSLWWKFAVVFYRARDRILPEKTFRRRLYEKITCRIKANFR